MSYRDRTEMLKWYEVEKIDIETAFLEDHITKEEYLSEIKTLKERCEMHNVNDVFISDLEEILFNVLVDINSFDLCGSEGAFKTGCSKPGRLKKNEGENNV